MGVPHFTYFHGPRNSVAWKSFQANDLGTGLSEWGLRDFLHAPCLPCFFNPVMGAALPRKH